MNTSPNTDATHTRWLTVGEAADHARCGIKLIYREVKAGRLRAAKVGGRRELRLLPEWIDQWLLASTTPIEVNRGA
jgi:excisionase family DNA binding protein